jgi:3-dehydroquinate synthase
MGDILVYNFTIKSRFHDYSVSFIDDTLGTISDRVKKYDVIIIDRKLKNLYPDLFYQISKNNLLIEIEAHEKNKSYEELVPVINQLIQNNFRKNHRLVGIGGGIIQDITAFISSIMYRGVNWILFPTTLLAQGDSCIGSKTSINFKDYKNQIGGFYPPNEIFIDTNFLETLSLADIQSGIGEMSHYFVVSGEDDFLEFKNDFKKLESDKSILKKMIANSLAIKKKYIEIDEFDQNQRQVFNYGHSFGHAIESLTNYQIPHGIAVSFGMDIANFISLKMGILDSKTRLEIRELLENFWTNYNIRKINVDNFQKALSKDKKNVGSELRLILCKGYGEVFKAPVKNDEKLHLWLSEYFENELL